VEGIVAGDPIKKVLPESFEGIENKNPTRQDNNENIASQKNISREAQEVSAAKFRSMVVKPAITLVENKNLNEEDSKGKSEISPDQANEIAMDVKKDASNGSLPKVIADSVTKDRETKNVVALNKQTTMSRDRAKGSWKWGLNLSAGVSGVPSKFLGSLDKTF